MNSLDGESQALKLECSEKYYQHVIEDAQRSETRNVCNFCDNFDVRKFVSTSLPHSGCSNEFEKIRCELL